MFFSGRDLICKQRLDDDFQEVPLFMHSISFRPIATLRALQEVGRKRPNIKQDPLHTKDQNRSGGASTDLKYIPIQR